MKSRRPGRQRIEHAETADRKGRVVAVERHVAASAPAKKAAGAQHRPGARDKTNKTGGRGNERHKSR